MLSASSPLIAEQTHRAPQRFQNGAIHDWYRFVWGFSDHLVARLLDEFGLNANDSVLDPFCGTGTTLVECLKRGIGCTGVDANPASLFAAKVKTRWHLDGTRLLEALEKVLERANRLPRSVDAYIDEPTYAYMRSSGMLHRGWINSDPLASALALKTAILNAALSAPYRDALMLALIQTVVQDASNIRFGPEAYVAFDRRNVDVFTAFGERTAQMAFEVFELVGSNRVPAVVLGDARDISSVLKIAAKRRGKQRLARYEAVICSPPYPAEHDYTRNARLELAFLEFVDGVDSLRSVKKEMIRSHTKGIYTDDQDWKRVWLFESVARVASEIERRTAGQDSGFVRLYSTVIASYFGGMLRHLQSIRSVLVSQAKLAYVVSDQASYADVHVPTGSILGELAECCGFKVTAHRHWRSRQSSVTSRVINEHILVLEWPGRSPCRRFD